MTTRLSIEGNAGVLEAEVSVPDGDSPTELAILCHPHPLYGGNMHDHVLGTLADVLENRGIATVRFNFRGTGGSDGAYSGSGGEVEDLLAVLRWARETYPDAGLLLGGYSFGAAIVASILALAEKEVIPTRALLIAPPVENLPPPDGTIPVDVFAGDQDAFVDITTLEDWGSARLHRIEGADHFFGGYQVELKEAIDAVVS